MPFLVFVSALVIAALGAWLALKLGPRLGLMQFPGGRRRHPRPISRLGGIGLFAGFFGVGATLYFSGFLPADTNLHLPLLGVLVGTALAALAGLADDRLDLKPAPQFLAQLALALFALFMDIFIGRVTLPVFGEWEIPLVIAYPLSVFWIMGMLNTVNWLDGLDGLAAGVGAIAALLFALHSLQLGQPEVALYSFALAGACLGFLLFNFHPARVFLGSSGAMALGFALAALSIIAPARVMTALLVMAIPIVDVAFQIVDRWRHGRSPLQGDRGHLHFRLADLGLPQPVIVLGYWLFCLVFAAAALLIESRLVKLATFGVLVAVVVGLLLFLSRWESRGEARREDAKQQNS
ncbi:MAG: undecaprenyl/decaprenyl-phosphate alpha-N-acetylglucosaminyl 1-phosphate transferase [Anaerolineales bacterium]|nr:undecaprenyl/decaprenyl-phosphate alpha-N-acetylglucosaminyl 1-phosphate transferase [Anaerolineales bacterium]